MTRQTTTMLALTAFVLAPPSCREVLPPEPPHMTDRDGPGTPIGAACVTLRRLECPEGLPSNVTGKTCFESVTVAAAFATFPAECVAAATTIALVQACGDRNTIRVRCRREP